MNVIFTMRGDAVTTLYQFNVLKGKIISTLYVGDFSKIGRLLRDVVPDDAITLQNLNTAGRDIMDDQRVGVFHGAEAQSR